MPFWTEKEEKSKQRKQKCLDTSFGKCTTIFFSLRDECFPKKTSSFFPYHNYFFPKLWKPVDKSDSYPFLTFTKAAWYRLLQHKKCIMHF